MNTLTINTTNTAYKNTSILFFAFLLFFFAHSSLQAATMAFDNGFESGNLDDFSCAGNCPNVTASPIASGKYSGNFVLTRDMSTPYRTEATLGNAGKFNFNQEYWIGYNHRFEDWAKDSDTDMAMQIHPAYTDWSWATTCPIGSGVGADSFTFLTANDQLKFVTYGGNVKWTQPLKHKQWQSIVFHFIPSGGSNGLVEAWVDGVKVASVTGKNTDAVDSCGHTMAPPYLKLGIYKWNWKDGRPATQSTRRQIIFDNVKIASGSNGYSLVSSTSTTTPIIPSDTTPPVISNAQAAVTDTTATITWDTNEASDSAVNYGTTTSYGSNAGNSLSVTSHSVTVQNLTSNSLYHYKVSSKDSSGNTGSGTDLTFTTNRAAGEDLVAYWPMDPGTGTTLPDLSGNGHTGKLVNGALLTTSGGVKFDGIDDYADVGKFDVAGKAMSISAWVWSDSLSNCTANSCRIISKAVSNAEQDHYFSVTPITVGSATRLRFLLKLNGATSVLTAASGNLSNKVWFHVAAVYDGTVMRLYKDGVEVGSMAKSGSITTNSNASVWLGGNPPNAKVRPWKGQIDDVSLYSYALTKEEIAELAK